MQAIALIAAFASALLLSSGVAQGAGVCPPPYPGAADFSALAAAETCADAAGLTDPRRAEALLAVAEMRSALGDGAGAQEAARRALTLAPGPSADPIAGPVLRPPGAAPGDAEALLLLAGLSRERPEEALRLAERAAGAEAPARRRAAARHLAGEIRADAGDAAGAKADFQRALELGGEDPGVLRALARLECRDPVAPCAYAQRALEAAQAAPAWCRGAAFRTAGQAFLDVRDYRGALAAFARALAVDPEDVQALQAMALVHRRRPQEPVPPLTRQPSLDRGWRAPAARDAAPDPGSLESLRVRVLNRFKARDPAQAASEAARFTESVARAPAWQRFDGYRLSVEMWLDLGDEEKAGTLLMDRLEGRDYQEAATQRLRYRVGDAARELPQVPLIVRLRRELGDAAGAQECLEQELRRLPRSRQALRLMAELQMAQGRPERALEYARRLFASWEQASPEDLVKEYTGFTFYPDPVLEEPEKFRQALEDPFNQGRARGELESGRRAARALLQDIERRIQDAKRP